MNVRGHWALGGQPARSRLDEQHRMALPWVLDELESYARYEWGHKRVTEAGCLRLWNRHLYLDDGLSRTAGHVLRNPRRDLKCTVSISRSTCYRTTASG